MNRYQSKSSRMVTSRKARVRGLHRRFASRRGNLRGVAIIAVAVLLFAVALPIHLQIHVAHAGHLHDPHAILSFDSAHVAEDASILGDQTTGQDELPDQATINESGHGCFVFLALMAPADPRAVAATKKRVLPPRAPPFWCPPRLERPPIGGFLHHG